MSGCRLIPTPAQEAVLRDHCAHDRYVWNLAVEPGQVRRLSRNTGELWIPKAGWIRFRWSRFVPAGSGRRGRVRLAIARLKAKEADRRKDWAEKASTDIARRFDVIRVEDLQIPAMTRSAKGTAQAPGRNVAAKSALSREILRSAWGLLVRRSADKAPGRVQKVDPAFTRAWAARRACFADSWVRGH
jgi:Helix-turn-helix domain